MKTSAIGIALIAVIVAGTAALAAGESVAAKDRASETLASTNAER